MTKVYAAYYESATLWKFKLHHYLNLFLVDTALIEN